MTEQFTLTFHGTRGSRAVNGPQHKKFGGHTTCFGVTFGQRQILIDGGSGIVDAAQAHAKRHFASRPAEPLLTYLFFTHAHYDHLCGMPYFAPFYIPSATTYIFGPRSPYMTFEEAMGRFLHPPFHPVPLYEMQGRKIWGQVEESDTFFFLKDVEAPVSVRMSHPTERKKAPNPEHVELKISCMRGYNHPKSGVILYKIEGGGKSVVVATDVEGYVDGDQRLIAFAKGADVLIHDAMYTQDQYTKMPVPPQGWGHSTVEIAARVAEAADVGRLYLVHHDPNHNDEQIEAIEAIAQAIFPASYAARDGVEVKLLG